MNYTTYMNDGWLKIAQKMSKVVHYFLKKGCVMINLIIPICNMICRKKYHHQ